MLKNKGYSVKNAFVVNEICIYVRNKISDNDLSELKNCYGYDLTLTGASVNRSNNISEYNYKSHHPLISEFKSLVNTWLHNNEFPIKHTMITSSINLHCYEKLSDNQISDFENEFNVTNKGYKLTCGKDEVVYEFED